MAATLPSHDSCEDIHKMTLFGSWNDLPAITQLNDDTGMLRNFSTNELSQLGCASTAHIGFATQQEPNSYFPLPSPCSNSDFLGYPSILKSEPVSPVISEPLPLGQPQQPPPQPTTHLDIPPAARNAIEQMRQARSYVASLAPDQTASAPQCLEASVLEAMLSCSSRDTHTTEIQAKLSKLTSVSSRARKASRETPAACASPSRPIPHSHLRVSTPPQDIPPTAKRSLEDPTPSPPSKRVASSSSPEMEMSFDSASADPRLVASPADVMAHVGNRLGRHLHRQMALQAALGIDPNNICLNVSEQGGVGVDLNIAGVLQCAGTNRKKKTRCRNAALMEYVGPRPIYCAEHISLDPNALYHKCGMPLSSDKGPKLCKEIVLHNFKHCYKHIEQWLCTSLVGPGAVPETQKLLATASTLLVQLEQEAARAKCEDSELYQRKSKLIPKYQSLVKTLTHHVQRLEGNGPQSKPSSDAGSPSLTEDDDIKE